MSTETAMVLHEAPPLPSLMDGPDPMLAIAYARKLSTALATVLSERNGYVTISGRKHVEISGWTTLAAMTNHTCEVEWTRIVPGMEDEHGVQTWEARAIVRDGNGDKVATGESMADPSERDKKGKLVPWGHANFSVRSMAATRAQVRAYASRLRYITVLAGMSGTPAEEMTAADDGGNGGGLPTTPVWQERQHEAEGRAAALGVTDFVAFFSGIGVHDPKKLAGAAVWKKVTDELDKREAEAAPVIEGVIVTDAEKDAALGLDNTDPPEDPDTAQTLLDEKPSDVIARRRSADPDAA